MIEIFRCSKNSVYSLRCGIQLEKPSINTVQFGNESTVYLGAKLWKLISLTLNLLNESVDIFNQ